jgi:putative ABC transport system ATP-binding protein
MSQNTILRLDNVCKTYDMGKAGKLTVLKDINIDINEGDFIAITGPSGSGKSTMMNIVGALDTPSQGVIYLKNKDIAKMRESSLAVLRGKTVGFIFQQFNLIPTLSALQNVMLPMEFIETPPSVAKERSKELLILLGLGDRMHHKPTELSGGQQQRVAIARALANDPEIVLADEPTGNLDSTTGKFVMNFLGKLNSEKRKTIILITHDINLVKYAKKTIFLKDGRIIKETLKGG